MIQIEKAKGIAAQMKLKKPRDCLKVKHGYSLLFIKIVVAIVEFFVGVIAPARKEATVVIVEYSTQERKVKKHCY